jgi:hypothetical protein
MTPFNNMSLSLSFEESHTYSVFPGTAARLEGTDKSERFAMAIY